MSAVSHDHGRFLEAGARSPGPPSDAAAKG